MAQYAPIQTSPEWHPSLANQHRSNILTHSKRKAEDELESQSHIASQFKKLRLNQAQTHHPSPNHVNGYLNAVSQTYTPQHHYPAPAQPSPSTQSAQPTSPTISFRPHIANTDARPALPAAPRPIPRTPPQAPVTNGLNVPSPDIMPLDETPHRVIISDLSSEIAQIEAEEAASAHHLFLPDIDKKVSALPQHLLQSGQNHDRPFLHTPPPLSVTRPPQENLNTALILYKDPSSISVPEEEDVVRKTIIEARRRAREKTAEQQRERERWEREAETRALEQHWDDGMVDHSFHEEPRGDDVAESEAEEMDEDSDPMDIE